MNSIISKFFTKNRQNKNINHRDYRAIMHGNNPRSCQLGNYENFCREGYNKNVIVFRAINLIASSLASIPLIAYQKTSDGNKIVKDHPIKMLFNHPNHLMSRSEFFENIACYKLISGNCFILKVGEEKPIALYVLRPDRIKVMTDTRQNLIGYQYCIGKNKKKYCYQSINW